MYLLIFEDQTIKQVEKDVSEEEFDSWLQSIDAGILTVIKFKHDAFLELHSNGEWYPI